MKDKMDTAKKIMLVDDDPNIIDILTIRLKKVGFDVVSCSAGLDVLNKVLSEQPDLIILDVMLPQLDGYRICRMLKFDDRYEHIPIIMLTAKAEKKSKEIGLETGADRYITKPFDIDQLVKEIEAVLKEKEKA
ncbi:MAG: response regulator [Candidatus Omnitrophota bacterium]